MADNLPTYVSIVMKSGSLNLLGSSEPVQGLHFFLCVTLEYSDKLISLVLFIIYFIIICYSIRFCSHLI